ncbi:general secretion pathway protein GspB [Shewanella loihica]|uniref:General secretion pathway protein B n=1 Tax=Shewanella loihica (strain ATCC BAA-1088 / PV-4) TaxID=323850 RepID=A3QBN3_SHELP|nr:general secretion pathway protein GspB [Shewanella loihica]ABO22881.1 general secretion pathway protein B [Shewanella loihica PV-4]
MSILLDAVTRAKQQDQQLDPVITPRAQYEAMQPKWPLVVKLGLLGTGLGGAIALAWVLSGQGELGAQKQAASVSNVSSISSQQTSAMQTQALPQQQPQQQRVAEQPTAQPSLEQNPLTGIKLAGKVALPLPVERPSAQARTSEPMMASTTQPRRQQAAQSRVNQSRANQSSVNTSATSNQGYVNDLGADEPIILGANANERGRELLSSLKAQVDEAAADVGLDAAYVEEQRANQGLEQAFDQASEQQAEPVAEQRPVVKDTSKLVAAFEAALKEVEKENAVATPVTQPKLDPIPAAQPDELPKYGQLPAGIQLQVPEFNILAHVYANDPKNRWLNVDGAELQQGDMIGGKLKIVEIRPRDVVLEVAGTEFKVPAI